jgi:arylsulfatase A-like enzyme
VAGPAAPEARERGNRSAWIFLVLAIVVTVACIGSMLFVIATPRASTSPNPTIQPAFPLPSTGRSGAAAGGRTQDQPNIVMIVTDDMRTDELADMPNVRRLLVRRGTWFTQGISPHPMCCPARAEMNTGEYAQNNGVHHNEGEWGGFKSLTDPANNIGAWLQNAGYFTAFVGKYLNGYRDSDVIPGWNIWEAATANVYRYHEVTYSGVGTIKGYVAHTTTRYTEAAIDAGHKSGRPFYVVSNYLAPHAQMGPHGKNSLPVPEPRYRHACDTLAPPMANDPAWQRPITNGLPSLMATPDRDAMANVVEARHRACALKSVDDGVGRIVKRLEKDGELADTEIVFVSDNGFNMGEDQLHGKNLITDKSLQVPMIIRGPGFPAGLRTDRLASLVDLPATYLDLAGGPASRPQDGVSLLKVLGDQPVRDTLLVQTGDSVDDSSPGFAMRGVTTARYLYGIDPSNPDQGVLFDRVADPHALVNFFDDPRYAGVRAELQRRLDVLKTCSGPDCNQVFGPEPEPGR